MEERGGEGSRGEGRGAEGRVGGEERVHEGRRGGEGSRGEEREERGEGDGYIMVHYDRTTQVWRSTHFYFCHRLIHTRFLYK